MTGFISNLKPDRWYKLLGVLIIIIAWQLLSMKYISVLVPSPAETLAAGKSLVVNGELLANLEISFKRQISGLFLGVTFGLVTGLLAGLKRNLELLMMPLINTLITVPAVIFVVMAMVWFGMGTKMAIFLVALLVFPVMHINTVEGFKSIDRAYLEMATVFQVPLLIKIKKIYFPGVLHSLVAGLSLSTATSVRLTIMAELLGAQDGMGQKIAMARAYLQTDQLFAWVLILICIVLFLEWFLIRPLNNFALRWKSQN